MRNGFYGITFLVLNFVMTSCATLDMKMLKKTHSGYPKASEALFLDSYDTYKDGSQETLVYLCLSLLYRYEFDKLNECFDALQDESSGKDQFHILHNQRSAYFLETNQNEKLLKEAQESENRGKYIIGIMMWELEAHALSNLKETPKRKKRINDLIKMINDYRFKAFFGLMTVGEQWFGPMRSAATTRIYLRQNKIKEARLKLQEKLPGKHFSEILFEGVFNYLQSGIERTAEAVIDKLNAKENKEIEDMKYLSDMLDIQMIATLSLKEMNIKNSIQGFRRILDDKRIFDHKLYYLPSLYYISLAYLENDEAKNSKVFWDAFLSELDKIKPNYRTGVIASYQAHIKRDFRDLKFKSASKFCKRWNKSLKNHKIRCSK
ncbi:MAG: hypothetical protein BM556_16715 [Bacteriovorax sp. MedPE-SWde]|nr:MAG: hypothetical protein BM556_16715 [Bacteriovorax sp. MedPE-SWde]